MAKGECGGRGRVHAECCYQSSSSGKCMIELDHKSCFCSVRPKTLLSRITREGTNVHTRKIYPTSKQWCNV